MKARWVLLEPFCSSCPSNIFSHSGDLLFRLTYIGLESKKCVLASVSPTLTKAVESSLTQDKLTQFFKAL